jgi:hypothetical protein
MTDSRHDQAVIVRVKMSDGTFGTVDEREVAQTLGEGLRKAVLESGGGEFDGHEFGEGWCRFYMYADDADLLAEVVLPVVRASLTFPRAFVVKRYGPPGSRQAEVSL